MLGLVHLKNQVRYFSLSFDGLRPNNYRLRSDRRLLLHLFNFWSTFYIFVQWVQSHPDRLLSPCLWAASVIVGMPVGVRINQGP